MDIHWKHPMPLCCVFYLRTTATGKGWQGLTPPRGLHTHSPCSTFSGPFPPSAPPLSIFLPQYLLWSLPRSWNDWALPFCQAFGAEGNSLKWSSGQLSLKNHPPEILSCLWCVSLIACQGRARALQLICFLPYCLSSPLEQAMSTVALIIVSPFHSGSTWTWYLLSEEMDGWMHARMVFIRQWAQWSPMADSCTKVTLSTSSLWSQNKQTNKYEIAWLKELLAGYPAQAQWEWMSNFFPRCSDHNLQITQSPEKFVHHSQLSKPSFMTTKWNVGEGRAGILPREVMEKDLLGIHWQSDV